MWITATLFCDVFQSETEYWIKGRVLLWCTSTPPLAHSRFTVGYVSLLLGPNALPDAPRKHQTVLIYTHCQGVSVTSPVTALTWSLSPHYWSPAPVSTHLLTTLPLSLHSSHYEIVRFTVHIPEHLPDSLHVLPCVHLPLDVLMLHWSCSPSFPFSSTLPAKDKASLITAKNPRTVISVLYSPASHSHNLLSYSVNKHTCFHPYLVSLPCTVTPTMSCNTEKL